MFWLLKGLITVGPGVGFLLEDALNAEVGRSFHPPASLLEVGGGGKGAAVAGGGGPVIGTGAPGPRPAVEPPLY